MKTKELIDLVTNNNFFCLADVERELEKSGNPPHFIRQELGSYAASTYITLINIYQCDDGFVGVTGIVPDEEYTPEDIDEPCTAEEYSPIPSTDYVPTSKIKSMGFNQRVELQTKDSEI